MADFANPLERWNSRFSIDTFLFGSEPNGFLKEQQAFFKEGLALSIADGEGRNSVWLAQQCLKVDAFDFSPVAIKKAQDFAKNKNVKINFTCSSWEDFSWEKEKYDYVVGIFFQFVGPEKRKQLFEKMVDSIKIGGLMVIQGYGLRQLEYKTGGPGELDHLYDETLMRELLPNFEFQVLKTYETTIHEGTGHHGMSSLVGVVAKKQK